MMAVSGKTLKREGWKAQSAPEEGAETIAYRRLIVEAVETLYASNKLMYEKMGWTGKAQPVGLAEIYRAVQNKIDALKRLGSLQHKELWPYPYRSKRYVDRRVNETASPKFYQDGNPKIIAVTAGYYEIIG